MQPKMRISECNVKFIWTLPSESIFGVSQSTIKRGQKQTRLHFADPLLRKAEAEIPVAVQTPAPSIRRTSSRQSELLRGQKVR